MSPRFWVTDGSAVPPSLIRACREDGGVVGDGFDLPVDPWDLTDRRLTRVGEVVDEGGVSDAVMAAARGVGVLVACADEPLRDLLIEDLGRLGAVDVELVGPDPLDVLDDDQRRLLARLAEGDSVAAAARILSVSTRTAERRLSSARSLLGVRTTAEAIVLAQESTWAQEVGDG